MQQLPLDIRLDDFALFATYHAGPNQAVVEALRHLALNAGPQVHWVWGRRGSGRSHLLQAAVAAAAANNSRCAWLPLGQSRERQRELSPAMLEGMGELDLLCVDDVDAVAGQSAWEYPLFSLFEELKANGGSLVVSAAMAPGEAGFSLRDLSSRLASGPTWRIKSLGDEDLPQALQLRARWRGLELSDEAAVFLVRRVTREPGALFKVLDVADTAALAAQRKLTVPFLKTVLNDLCD